MLKKVKKTAVKVTKPFVKKAVGKLPKKGKVSFSKSKMASA